jgi:hypothetical protein
MPYKWNPETERALLLAAITESDHKPSNHVWNAIATKLGEGLTASAVSYDLPSMAINLTFVLVIAILNPLLLFEILTKVWTEIPLQTEVLQTQERI